MRLTVTPYSSPQIAKLKAAAKNMISMIKTTASPTPIKSAAMVSTILSPVTNNSSHRKLLTIERNSKYSLSGASALTKNLGKFKQQCIFFSRHGTCARLAKCPFAHDKTRINICQRFLRGTCEGSCKMSHVITKDKLPVCLHYLQGTCFRDQCQYPHLVRRHKTHTHIYIYI